MSAVDRAEASRHMATERAVPNPWGALAAVACFTAIAAVIGIGLLEHYFASLPAYAGTIETTLDEGPVDIARTEPPQLQAVQTVTSHEHEDFTAQTSQIGNAIEEALRAAGSLHVQTERSELRQSDTLRWEYRLVQAQFASESALTDLTPRLAKAIAGDSVRIEPISGAPAGQAWLSVRCNGIECATVHAVSEQKPNLDVKLAALAVEWYGFNSDELMQEFHPNSDALPLDSTDFKIDAPMPSSAPDPAHTGPLRLSIIVDDGGYGGWITEEILAMPNTLTLSILPHAPDSYETAKRATELGFEVMLHMPMENVSGKTTYPGEITVTMDANEMLDLTNQAIADVPGAVGINNHTGSKFTSNADAMRTWLNIIKDRGYFFVDSRTSRHACAFEVADEMEIPSAENDLFLDHQAGPDYIRARFKEIIAMVKRHGQAIAICHFRKNTVPVLKAMLPQLEKEGIEIVHASTLVR